MLQNVNEVVCVCVAYNPNPVDANILLNLQKAGSYYLIFLFKKSCSAPIVLNHILSELNENSGICFFQF